MNHICSDCGVELSSQTYLDHHKKKSVPCNFKCRICNFIGKDRFAFYRHQKKAHPITEFISKRSEKRPSLDIVPLEDFNAQTLRDTMRKHATNVKQTRVQSQLVNGETGVGTDVAEVDAIITTYHIRANDLREMIPDELLISVIKSFEIDTSTRKIYPVNHQPVPGQFTLTERQLQLQYQMQPHLKPSSRLVEMSDNVTQATDQISELLFSLLNGVHGSDNKRLHSICIGDMARKNVNFYSRTPLGDKTYWQTNSKDLSIKKLQSHVKELYRFIIEAVVGTLKPCFITSTKEFVWALKTPFRVYAISAAPLQGILNIPHTPLCPIDDSDDIIVMMNSLYARHTLTRTREPGEGSRVTVTTLLPEDITDCLDGDYLQERKDLSDLIQIKKGQLHFKLDRIELDSKKCIAFLNDTYPICVGTLKSTR